MTMLGGDGMAGREQVARRSVGGLGALPWIAARPRIAWDTWVPRSPRLGHGHGHGRDGLWRPVLSRHDDE